MRMMKELSFDSDLIVDELDTEEYHLGLGDMICKYCHKPTVAAYDEDDRFLGSACCGNGVLTKEEEIDYV